MPGPNDAVSSADQNRTPGTGAAGFATWRTLLIAGLALRIALMLLRPADLENDVDAYLSLARTLAQQDGYYRPGTTVPTAYRPPGLPVVLAGLLKVGLAEPHAVAAVNIAAFLLTMMALRKLTQQMQFSSRASLAAAYAVAFDPLLLRYSLLPMTEVLTAAVLTTGIMLLIAATAVDSGAPGGKPAAYHGNAFAAGLVLGVAALCRPVVLVTIAVLAAALIRRYARLPVDRKLGSRSSVRIVGLLICGAAVALAPWIIRNAVYFRAFVPATTHGGYTLLLGNNRVFFREVVPAAGHTVWQEESLRNWQWQLKAEMLADGVDPDDEVASDKWMYRRARMEISAAPASFMKACLLRWRRFWALAPSAEPVAGGTLITGAIAVWYGVLWAGLAGSLTSANRQRPDIQLLWAAVLSFCLIHTFYWTNTRMRAPLMPLLAVLSVQGWQFWRQFLSSRLVNGRA